MSLEAPSYFYYSIITIEAQSLYLLFSSGKKNIPCGVPSCSVGYTLCNYCCSLVMRYESENVCHCQLTIISLTLRVRFQLLRKFAHLQIIQDQCI